MPQAQFRFYAELNDFPGRARRQLDCAYRFGGTPAVKDAVEAFGVPHTEVDVIRVNGEGVPFNHRLRDGDQVSVYPVFESLDGTPVFRLRPRPLRRTRFALDAHLGRLAGLLRLFGFDASYRKDRSGDPLAELAPRGRRILLTRDRGLLMRRAITHGYSVRAVLPDAQLLEVLRRFQRGSDLHSLARYQACIGVLDGVPVGTLGPEILPADVRAHSQRVVRRRECPRVFGEGSHVRRLRGLAADVESHLQAAGAAGTGGEPPT